MKPLRDRIRNKKALCFIDLEGTQLSHEIIEIGAYRVTLKKDGSFNKVYPPFKRYVIPKHRIGSFVTKLTGITEKQIDREAISYRQMLNDFVKYLGRDFESTLFIAYGNQDGAMFTHSAENNLDASEEISRRISKNVFDFSAFLGAYLRSESNNIYSLEHACEHFNISFQGQAHDALADAKNLMLLYQKVDEQPELVAKEYKRTLTTAPQTPRPLRILLRKLKEKKTITEQDWDEAIVESLK